MRFSVKLVKIHKLRAISRLEMSSRAFLYTNRSVRVMHIPVGNILWYSAIWTKRKNVEKSTDFIFTILPYLVEIRQGFEPWPTALKKNQAVALKKLDIIPDRRNRDMSRELKRSQIREESVTF